MSSKQRYVRDSIKQADNILETSIFGFILFVSVTASCQKQNFH